MTEPLRVLLVEDSESDAKLVSLALRAIGRELRIERVQDPDAMRAAMARATFDIVISDWSMPRFSGRAALAVLQEAQLDLPFIIVSGTVGEELAVDAMRAGAHDYVLKDKLARLAPAVERELRERDARTARREADEALRLQEARFRALIERSDEGIALSDREVRILYVSPGARRILGLGDRDVEGIGFLTVAHPDDTAAVFAAGQRVRQVEAMSEVIEFRIVRPDGEVRWIELTLVNRLEDPAVAALVSNFHDITERKHAYDLLRESEARFRALIERSDEGISLADANGRLVYVSPGGRRILGYADAVTTEVFYDVYVEDRAAVGEYSMRIRERPGMAETLEFRIVLPDGRTRWLETTLVNRLDDPTVGAVVANFRDVTDRRKLLDAVRESEARFRRLWDSGVVGIAITDLTGGFLDANQGLLDLLGHERDDLVSGRVRWNEITPPESQAATAAAIAGVRERGRYGPFEKEYFRKDGSRVPTLVAVASLGDGRNLTVIIDLSAQKNAEQARQLSETRFRRLWESGLVGIAITDMAGDIVEANPAMLELVGYTAEDLAAGRMRWLDMTPPESMAGTDTAVAQLIATGTAAPWEQEYIRKDGTRVWVLVGAATVPPNQNVSLVLDVSARRKAEQALEATEGQLRQAQKMEAIGRLAGGIAHDFNNLLSVILSYGELIQADLKEGDPMREDAGEICKAGLRAAELTTQLLMFSRQQVLEPKVTDLNDVLADMDKMLRRMVGEDVELTSVAARPLGLVKVDKSSIQQVVMNLAVNARDAMPTGGQLTIETADCELDEEFARAHVGLHAGPHVMLAVTDTGTGMDRATQAHVFEPFFTTKAVGKGTGLGLSTVFGIVHQSGGTVWVYSELGKGTTFKIYLPRVGGRVTGEFAMPPIDDARATETILLVEDEDAVRAVARGILQRSGYTVLEARNAGEALLHSETHAGEIHLLLTDVVMPQMGGPALAKRLAQTRPDIKVICMSGYTDDSIVRHGVLEAQIEYLQKPLTPDTLRRKVRKVLDAPRRR